jgi:acyl-CoA thioesterase FadM
VVDGAGERVYAAGTVVLVAYDYAKQESIHVPDDWRERLERYEGRNLR